MMEISNISLVYILARLGGRFLDFFRHWYYHGSLRAAHLSYNILEKMDRTFALRISFKNWFQPLYQDYSAIGYLWGFIFRTIRIFLALLVYGVFILVAAGLFLAWAAIPPFVIYKIFINLH